MLSSNWDRLFSRLGQCELQARFDRLKLLVVAVVICGCQQSLATGVVATTRSAGRRMAGAGNTDRLSMTVVVGAFVGPKQSGSNDNKLGLPTCH